MAAAVLWLCATVAAMIIAALISTAGWISTQTALLVEIGLTIVAMAGLLVVGSRSVR